MAYRGGKGAPKPEPPNAEKVANPFIECKIKSKPLMSLHPTPQFQKIDFVPYFGPLSYLNCIDAHSLCSYDVVIQVIQENDFIWLQLEVIKTQVVDLGVWFSTAHTARFNDLYTEGEYERTWGLFTKERITFRKPFWNVIRTLP